MIIGQASKPKKAHGKMAAVDLESDIVKKGDGCARLPQACFTFKMALKFKPVVVTAVLICDPLFSVRKSYRDARLLRACFSLSRVLLSRVFL